MSCSRSRSCRQYAEAGIAHYRLVELGEPDTLTTFELADGACEPVEKCTGEVKLSRPAPLVLDLDGLTRVN